MNFGRSARRGRAGASAVEYGLLAALIAVVSIAALDAAGAVNARLFERIEGQITKVNNREMCAEIGGYLDDENGHCYARFADPLDWDSAQQACGAVGGHLATSTTPAENQHLADVVLQGATGWIGMTDRAQEGVFVWTTGEALTYDAWYAGEPNDHGSGEDCVELNHHDVGSWNDQTCSDPLPYICEIE